MLKLILFKQLTNHLKELFAFASGGKDSAKNLIVEKGTDAKYGARPLRRALQTELEDRLAEAILGGEVKAGDHVEAGVSKKEIKFIVSEK